MNAISGAGDDTEPRDADRLSVGDPVLRKTRLLSRQCATCIFRPGNPMHLAPNRLRELVAQARGTAGYIICHCTLPTCAGNGAEPAVCRGFADRYTTWQLQLIARLWGFVEVDPPDDVVPTVNARHIAGDAPATD
ncbi:MAG TPA: hypothetical protein VFC00_19480 [Micromonosporaceae bacterium]|nr:hypothetical protein [Micromonosporaceae bacterium]